MRTKIPDSCKTLGDVWYALVMQSMNETGLPESFREHCCTELSRLSGASKKHSPSADDAASECLDRREGGMVGFLQRQAFDSLGHPDAQMLDNLADVAELRWEQAQQCDGEARRFRLAEVRLCVLLGEIPLETLGIDPDVLGVVAEPAEAT